MTKKNLTLLTNDSLKISGPKTLYTSCGTRKNLYGIALRIMPLADGDNTAQLNQLWAAHFFGPMLVKFY